uniref:Arm DNA-binding domain-containing protein n=1 Tax=Methylobacterium planeticum TaxID=2615211 RepID=UPI001FF03F12|nr:Arm DNA-binding domain-containing protein [Methylobacterium planeticum]
MQSVGRYKPDANRRLEIPDATLPGFYLIIQPSGVKSWAVRYRHAGRPRKFTIGPYPLFDLTTAPACPALMGKTCKDDIRSDSGPKAALRNFQTLD